MANRIKKPFKLNVLGLFKWESENWTVKEVALILAMIMAFILILIILLKVYAIPTLTASPILGKIGFAVRKFLGSRSP
jgi:polyferredoxin